MKIIRNEDIDPGAWQELVRTCRYSTPFQTNAFYNLFNSVQGLSAHVIAVCDKAAIRALAVVTKQAEPGLKGYFSRRCVIYGGPLIEPEYPEALEMLLHHLNMITDRRVIYTETRNFSDYSEHKHLFLKNGYAYKPYLNFVLHTEEKDSVLKNISSSRRRQIKKAINSGVTCRIAQSPGEVQSFYHILENLYSKKIKKPLLPGDFFIRFLESGLGIYILVWYNGKVIGGIMCPVLEGKAIYEFYICGLDDQYKDQYPSIMATWAAIEYALQNQIPVFDFMGAGPPDGQYGVRDFKARFGGEMVEYGRFLKISKPLLYATGRLFIRISGGPKS